MCDYRFSRMWDWRVVEISVEICFIPTNTVNIVRGVRVIYILQNMEKCSYFMHQTVWLCFRFATIFCVSWFSVLSAFSPLAGLFFLWWFLSNDYITLERVINQVKSALFFFPPPLFVLLVPCFNFCSFCFLRSSSLINSFVIHERG